jgi:CRISPR-associated endonuclease/helicase Cas3
VRPCGGEEGSVHLSEIDSTGDQTHELTETHTRHLAHSANRFGEEDPLASHLQAVAQHAALFAEPLGATAEASLAGLLHDLGKYGDLFQARLRNEERGIDHWSAGAWAALTTYRERGLAVALSIQGHHVGLQRAAKDSLRGLDPLELQKHHPNGLRLSDPSVDRLLNLMNTDGLKLPDADSIGRSIYEGLGTPQAAAMLDVRMLFSTLVDADFLETEAHFRGRADDAKRCLYSELQLEPQEALSKLMAHIARLPRNSSAEVNELRDDLLTNCIEAAEIDPGLFTLTAPTGAGKTLSMLAFALKHAVVHELRRVIVVIPYLSIIEQTVREFRKALALPPLSRYVLEHHSLAGVKAAAPALVEDGQGEQQHKGRWLAENWDAPLIVTTSVQFLESLFADRPAACRKLHRLSRSVVLFDEVQTLPLPLVVPTLGTLSRLAERFASTVVFSTATQPAFSHLNSAVKRYCGGGWAPREIARESLRLFERARRTRVEWPSDDHRTSWSELAGGLARHRQVLCIVNLKRHALQLYSKLRDHDPTGLFHLSTNMCPVHRQAVLGEVRHRLEVGAPCRLVSTQCVEAGVDLDFPVAYRAFGPLDAIAQAAGRCNRNGRSALGVLRVFVPDEPDERSCYPDGAYRQAAGVTRILLRRYAPKPLDIDDPSLFREYYHELYDITKPHERNAELLEAIERQDFSEVARLYRVIPKDAINVVVPHDLAAFNGLAEAARSSGLNRQWVLEARPYAISLFRPRHDAPVRNYLEPVLLERQTASDDWFIYLERSHYDPGTGLVPPQSMECLIA